MTTKKKKETNFTENYLILQDIAKKLEESTEPDIDALLPMIEQATVAYGNCKSRIEAVKLALAEKQEQQSEIL